MGEDQGHKEEVEGPMKWEVKAYRGKNRDVDLGTSWVTADTERQAIELGKRAMRMIGVRGQFRVSVRLYRPECDRAFLGFIKQQS